MQAKDCRAGNFRMINPRVALIAAVSIIGVVAMLSFVRPLPQNLSYHQFADQRSWLGIPHVGDVLSNVPFTVIGLWGLWLLLVTDAGQALAAPALAVPYALFLAGVAAVGPASAYYHWVSDNSTLMWDRLPMSVAFMALFSAIIAERMGIRVGMALLVPLLAAGIASVLYWRVTDDLRPYLIVQFLPLALIPLMCWLMPSQGGLHGRYLVAAFLCYGLAKIVETMDWQIWQNSGQIVSGHNLKHLLAAGACLAPVMYIRKYGQSPRRSAASQISNDETRIRPMNAGLGNLLGDNSR